MEFFEIVEWKTDPAALAEALPLRRLPDVCSDIYELLDARGEE